MDTILPTTLVGSYPQPDWLIDRAKLAGRFVGEPEASVGIDCSTKKSVLRL